MFEISFVICDVAPESFDRNATIRWVKGARAMIASSMIEIVTFGVIIWATMSMIVESTILPSTIRVYFHIIFMIVDKAANACGVGRSGS